jgi:hypothetical protein
MTVRDEKGHQQFIDGEVHVLCAAERQIKNSFFCFAMK